MRSRYWTYSRNKATWVQLLGYNMGAGILKVVHVSQTFPVHSYTSLSAGTPGGFYLPGYEHSHPYCSLTHETGFLRDPGLGGLSDLYFLRTGLSAKTLSAKVLCPAF